MRPASAAPAAAFAGDDILDAIDQARKSYQDGNLTAAKQSLDLAPQLVGQKNAETFGSLPPPALPGWKAEKVETAAVGVAMFGASQTSDGTINMVVNNKYLVTIEGSADAASKLAYAGAVDIAKLSKM